MRAKDHVHLAARLRQSVGRENAQTTHLGTSQRVIARVTDGIYREPGSALRELVSNAYDADATRVVISTDAPRFNRIIVEDDGMGMAPEALAYLLHHIGGSAKRTNVGQELGITQFSDPTLSPQGRKLIGKLGIGLFSVSQLTRTFQVVTKVAGDEYRSIAVVRLHQFSDASSPSEDGTDYEAGEVLIWREPTPAINEHGTTVILNDLRPQTRDTLRSSSIWEALDNPVEAEAGEADPANFVPTYNIGRVNSQGDYLGQGAHTERNVPWDQGDSPLESFEKLVDAVWGVSTHTNPNPKLDVLFDYYLKMTWELSLALPLDYYRGHLFDEPADEWAEFYALSNEQRGHAAHIPTDGKKRVRDLMCLTEGAASAAGFRVFLDDLELRRPIRFRDLPMTSNKLNRPFIFLGKHTESFEGIDPKQSGGPLAFEAYLCWAPKIAPVDHRGVLVRVHGASGAPFDHTFFRYQVSEQTRLRQLTCEIFVSEGLEAALNIDREAYNTAHPHMVVLVRWLHSALRQFASAHKLAASKIRKHERELNAQRASTRLRAIVENTGERTAADSSVVPNVSFGGKRKQIAAGDSQHLSEEVPTYEFGQDVLNVGESSAKLGARAQDKLTAIVQLLAVFDLLDSLTAAQMNELVAAIAQVLAEGDE